MGRLRSGVSAGKGGRAEGLGARSRAPLSGFLLRRGPHQSSCRWGKAGSGRPVVCRGAPPPPLRAPLPGAGNAAGPALDRSIASSCSSCSTRIPLGTKVGTMPAGPFQPLPYLLVPPLPQSHSSPGQHPAQVKGKREPRIHGKS